VLATASPPVAADGSPPGWGRLRRALPSLRFRITAVATVLVALVLGATAVFSVQAQRRSLTERVDEQLEQRATEVSGLVTRGTVDQALAGEGGDETLTQVVAADGEIVAASANLAGEPAVAEPLGKGEPQRIRTVDAVPVGDDEFRLLSRGIETRDGTYVVHVAAAFDDVTESVAVLTRNLALAFPAVLVVLAAIVWVVVGRALRPVEAIRSEVAHITAAELDRRVPQPPTDDEIGRLAGTMNAMLDRIENAHRRQRRFVADASHELRSPLTSIRSELEVDLAHPDEADLAGTHRSVLEETVRLQRLVDDLLYLARSDDAAAPMRSGVVDLDEIVLREADAIRARGTVRVDTRRVSGAQMTGDTDQLTRAVRNLLDNAERHARSTVTVSLTESDRSILFAVGDDGPGVPADQVERIFERFSRLDDARDREHGGAGLGLAITHDIVLSHRGTIAVEQGADTGATFVVRMPRETDGPPRE